VVEVCSVRVRMSYTKLLACVHIKLGFFWLSTVLIANTANINFMISPVPPSAMESPWAVTGPSFAIHDQI
jgi:hypothetical protein